MKFVRIVCGLLLLGETGTALCADAPQPERDRDAQGESARLQHPIAHWRFDERAGTGVADSSGGGNDGTIFNAPENNSCWVDGRLGGALELNANETANAVVIIPDSPSLNFSNKQSFSLSVWVRSKVSSISAAGILCKGTGGGGEQYAMDIFEGKFRFFVRPVGKNPSSVVMPGPYINRRWQHLVGTFESGGMMVLYVNGHIAGSNAAPPARLLFNKHPVSIGSRESNSGTPYDMPFKGVIDDARIYDFALTSDEAQELYESAKPFGPRFYVPLQSARRRVGEMVTFEPIVDGMDPLHFQWQKNGTNIAGALFASVRLANVQAEDAGTYTLMATDRDGATASSVAVLTVMPFFWQTWWFWAVVCLLAILALVGIVHMLERRRSRLALVRLEESYAVDRERMRIARDVHDELGGKLSRISFLSDMAGRGVPDQSPARRQIEEIADVARNVIQTLDEIVWAVNPSNDTVESLVHYICRHAEEFFELTGIELELELPGQFPGDVLSAEIRHNLFCAVKEALNNILKHARATKARIVFIVHPASLEIRISDNGRGFNPQPGDETRRKNGESSPGRRGNGMSNMQRRLEQVRGSCSWQSDASQGTVVLLSLTLNRDGARPG